MPLGEIAKLKQQMEKTVEHLKGEYLGIRTGRAHPALVEEIKVDYYGTPTPVKQMGSVTVPDPRQLLITPWDKTALKAIEKGILASSLGVTPSVDGDVIRLTLPELTRQRRVDLTKLVRKYGEEAKVALRNVRRDCLEALKRMEKESLISEDDLRRYQKEVQDVTDEFTKKVDAVQEQKEKEIMED
ncbi:MAG: ribosome recycling factor [Synergistaceae bacterium]|jgi:ribosome recycling factor|nr:ribosome recycling factor [Synergistaceae bacterium]